MATDKDDTFAVADTSKCEPPVSMFPLTFGVLAQVIQIHCQILQEENQNAIAIPSKLKCPVEGKNVMFCAPQEVTLKKDNMLTTLPMLGKEWSLSFEFKPSTLISGLGAYPRQKNPYKNIIHLTTNSKSSTKNATNNGRILAIEFNPNNRTLSFSSSFGVSKGFYTQNLVANSLKVEKWSKIKFSQKIEGGKYQQTSTIDGNRVVVRTSARALEFTSVHVFASNPWRDAQPGKIRNLVVEEMGKFSLTFCISLNSYFHLLGSPGDGKAPQTYSTGKKFQKKI